jgi:hypothetical protein
VDTTKPWCGNRESSISNRQILADIAGARSPIHEGAYWSGQRSIVGIIINQLGASFWKQGDMFSFSPKANG